MPTLGRMSTVAITIEAFEATLEDNAPPPGCDAALAALWWARRGAWDQAHALVQEATGADAAWVHAWLHRAEGDDSNAAYWYRRAGQPAGRGPLADEWRVVAIGCLGDP